MRVFCVCGLQRSGNHAIIDWVRSLFPESIYFGDQPHNLFHNLEHLTGILDSCGSSHLIFSFEDSIKHSPDPSQPLLSTVTNFPLAKFPKIDVMQIYVLRDPYNLWASRLAGRERPVRGGVGLTSDPSWETFRQNWIYFANLYTTDPKSFILFNNWHNSYQYRKNICSIYRGEYSETTMNQVASQGGGSSFQGNQRSSYSEILKNPKKFLKPTILKRILKHPVPHAKKWLSPKINANQLAVEDRWAFLLNHPDGHWVLEDDEIRKRSLDIFQMAISKDGKLLSQEN